MKSAPEFAMAMTPKQRTQKADGKQKHVTICDFRSAGRISNELARALNSLHEEFARNLSAALDAFLGISVEVQLGTLDHLRFEEHLAAIPAVSCIVPYAVRSGGGPILIECDTELIFPMIDLLLGGAGSASGGPRDLSEIEEEIVLDVFSLIVRQAEKTWRLPSGDLVAGKCVKPAALDQYCSHSEKVACLRFNLSIGEIAGSFQFVLPATFLGVVLEQSKLGKPQRKTALRHFPRQGIRDRILDSDVEVAVELPGLRIAVRDLLALLPGSVVKLRASVRTPGMLIAGGQGIFEATPVRNGSRKAAQLGRRIAAADLERM